MLRKKRQKIEKFFVVFAGVSLIFFMGLGIISGIQGQIDIALKCEREGGDYCLSDDEIKCKNFCAPGNYLFYSKEGGILSSDEIECICGGEDVRK